ncbi:DUF1189 family protein [Candidatus Woesearchaeota archaeon]|nr:DUF1189 family protein [Candidatus Woesearchaeota archaeon]
MRLKEFAFLYVHALNPGNYNMLMTRKKRDALQYFFIMILFSIILGGILAIPIFITMPERIEKTLAKFDRFNITGIDIQLKEPVVLLKTPKIVLDLTANRTEIGKESILITKTEIMWKRPKLDILGFKLFNTEKRPLSDYSNVLENADRIKGLSWLLFLILLPSLFLITYVLHMVKYLVIIGLSTLFAFIFIKIKKKKPGIFKVARVAVYSITVLVFLEVVLGAYISLGIFSLLIYLLFFILCLMVITEKEFKFNLQK